ncbi:mechanosensitive ion channel family protein [Halomicrobium salinisoli]|uniref:mechanosensitive ion channel family protein n=1 Tax=Halomicrobium salinisoli TaxID=2878391 RepID=UPI001CF0A4F1|nr:mechanosensitive ion channel domain-containing protein [Halomicrobium salinisoli]
MQILPDFLARLLGTYADLISNIVEFLVIAVTLYLTGRLLVETFGRWALDHWDFDATMADGLMSFFRLAVVLLAVVVGASAADFRGALAGSALIAGGVTLAIGLGAQDVLSNFVAGAFLVQDPDINIGDRIQWEDQEGIIDGIDLRVTRIKTLNNEVIIVPNSELSTTVLTNLTAHDPVGFSYDFAMQHDELQESMTLIRRVAEEQEELLDTPGPVVRVTDLLESEVVVTVRAFFPQELRSQRARIRTKFFRRVIERCHEEGVELNQSSIQELTGGITVDPADDDRIGVESDGGRAGADGTREDD